MFWRHPRTSPLPYTTLFRSQLKAIRGALVAGCFFGQHQAICGMRPAGRSVFSTCNQLLESVFADGLQHGEARLAVLAVSLLDQTLIYKGGHASERVEAQILSGVTYGFHSFESASSDKYSQAPEESLFSGTELIVTPVDGGAEGLLTFGEIAGASCQELKAAREARLHREWGKNFH